MDRLFCATILFFAAIFWGAAFENEHEELGTLVEYDRVKNNIYSK